LIRLLAEEERGQAEALQREFASCGALSSSSSIVGAFTDGELIALLGVDSLVFLGPLIVKKEWRGRQLPVQLVEYVKERVPERKRVCIYTDNPHVKKLAEEFGMKRMPGEFYMVEV